MSEPLSTQYMRSLTADLVSAPGLTTQSTRTFSATPSRRNYGVA